MDTTAANNNHIGEPVKLKEQSRTYLYTYEKDNGQVVTVPYTYENVVELIVRPSGSHRLVTADGRLYFASAGFIGISIVPAVEGQWTV